MPVLTGPHTPCILRSALYGPWASCGPECLVVERYAWGMGARGEPLPDDVPDLAREAWQHGERVTRRARR